MKKTYRDNKHLAMDILRGQWLIDKPHEYREIARNFVNGKLAARQDPEKSLLSECICKGITGEQLSLSELDTQNGSSVPEDRSLILIVPVHGTLTKYDSCVGVSTQEVADILDEYGSREEIAGVVLDIDSPGGAANSVHLLVGAIRRLQAAGKPVISHVDLCCSAAYWIASATDAIFADNLLSSVGSIGAYCTIYDERENKATGFREIDIYAPESTQKNIAYREALDGKTAAMEKELSELVQAFIAAVKEGRPDLKDENGVTAGAVFYPSEAIRLGMINGSAELDSCVEIAYVRANK